MKKESVREIEMKKWEKVKKREEVLMRERKKEKEKNEESVVKMNDESVRKK